MAQPSPVGGLGARPNRVRGRAPEANAFRDAQSTEKSVFYRILSLVSVYGQTHYLWPESTDFFVLSSATTPPPPTLDSRDMARAE